MFLITHARPDSFLINLKSTLVLGLTIGGTWGLYEGLRNPDGRTMKLRLNSVLNGMTRRGPFLANSLGVVGKTVTKSSVKNINYIHGFCI